MWQAGTSQLGAQLRARPVHRGKQIMVATQKQQNDHDIVYLSVDDLQVGAKCRRPLEDDDGVLLLGAGTRITQELIQTLKDRQIEELPIHKDDLAALTKSASGRGPSARPKTSARTTTTDFQKTKPQDWPKGFPLREGLVDRRSEPLDEGRAEKLREHVNHARGDFEELRMAVTEQKLQTIEAMDALSNAFAETMVDDHDQTLGHIVTCDQQMTLVDRSVKLAVLGMAIATEMELDGPSVLDVGKAGLLHDIGLFVMDPQLSVYGRLPLTDEELWQYRKHPITSVNSLRDVTDLSSSVILAIEQVHEQFDGSGYPFGLEGKRAHVYSRILNVCDAYLRLVIGTSYRKALVPHDALGFLLHQAGYGVFDPKAVQAILRTESLFPLGSRVALDDGNEAIVIRRPETGYANPIVQDDAGNRIDLAAESVSIKCPLVEPELNQMRLSQQTMSQMRWSPADELSFD